MEVLEWFAGRVDLVLLLFDAHKLDISDELRRAIQALARWEEKIRIVLNKSDGVDSQQLMRVYGALMWSLGKVLKCPEVPRVYISSWWDHQLRHAQLRPLFELEEQDLFTDFRALPRAASLRKLNDMIKRARLARVMALIADELSSCLPVIRKEAAKKQLLKTLDEVIQRVEFKHGHCSGDLPPIDKLRQTLSRADWSKFRSIDKRQLVKLDRMLTEEMAKLVAMLPSEMSVMGQATLNGPIEASQAPTPFTVCQELTSPRYSHDNSPLLGPGVRQVECGKALQPVAGGGRPVQDGELDRALHCRGSSGRKADREASKAHHDGLQAAQLRPLQGLGLGGR